MSMEPATESRLACRYCIAYEGLKGSQIKDLPRTQEELFAHIESEHHLPVQRQHETREQTQERFKKEQPDAGGPSCKCPSCRRKRA